MFVAAYILVWAYAGLVVYVLLHAGKDLVYHFGWYQNGAWARLALGVTLTLAGLYQFTPLKRLCLHRCRSSLAFLKEHWRDVEDAAEMGLWHGLYCLGCCWALFGVMLAAAGMMSIAWMLLMTLVVFADDGACDALAVEKRLLSLLALGHVAAESEPRL
jgi:predicted metal-binding membrane protein